MSGTRIWQHVVDSLISLDEVELSKSVRQGCRTCRDDVSNILIRKCHKSGRRVFYSRQTRQDSRNEIEALGPSYFPDSGYESDVVTSAPGPEIKHNAVTCTVYSETN